MRPSLFLCLAFLGLLLPAAASPAAPPGGDETPWSVDSLRVASGFRIALFADGLPGVRSLTVTPKGTVFAGTASEGRVYAVKDDNGDGRADEVLVVDEGLTLPSGVAARGGDLYVAEAGRILLYDGLEGALYDPPEPIVVSNDFPADTFRPWHTIAFGPDGKLYASIGAPCNACASGDERFATIVRMDRNGLDFEIFARGIRSAGGLAWEPESGALLFTDAGRAWLGDDFPPDELCRAGEPGLHFGFPWCHGDGAADPELAPDSTCDRFTPPVALLDAHAGAFGLCFPRDERLPEEVRRSALVAERGSLYRNVPSGFRVVRVDLAAPGEARVEEFAGGWLRGGRIHGRPTDLLVRPEGDVLLSDEYAGVIYRIWYAGDGDEAGETNER
jgi:glucose/arabinose dehydrogenase